MFSTWTPTARAVGISCVVSVAAGLFGFDTGTIAALSKMPYFEEQFGELSPLMHGLVVAIILPPSALTGMIAGVISDRISRKYTISLGSAIFAVGSAISTGSNSLPVLILGRCVAGCGEGLFLSVIGVYICEISPKHIRGKMILLIQLFTASAIAFGFFVCYGTILIDSSLSWRFPFALSTFTALTLALTTPLLPFSPRWLVSKGRRAEAEAVLDLLAGTQNAEERTELLAAGPEVGARKASFTDIFAKGVRGRTCLGIFLNVFQQLSGIDFVLFFAPLLFAQAGLDPSTAAFIASGVTGLVLVAMTLIGTLYIDRAGRRTLFLAGGVMVSFCLLMLGVLYATGAAQGSVGKWFVIAFIELFAASFSATWSLVIRLYSSEIQPSRTRATATAVGQGANQAVNFVVALTAPAFLARSAFGPYLCYGAFTAFATVVAYLYMPETIHQSLERIDKTFEGSPYAVKWPTVFLSTGTSDLRNRRASRAGSSTLPGETRAEFKANMELHKLKALNVVGSGSAIAE